MKTLIIPAEGEGRLDIGIKGLLGNPDLHSFYITFKPVNSDAVWPRYLVEKKLITSITPITVECVVMIEKDFTFQMMLFPKAASLVKYKLHPKQFALSPQLRTADTEDDGN